jgi:hypothetical protein
MPRPKGKKRFPATITLVPATKREAARVAMEGNESLSHLINRLLEQHCRAAKGAR